MLHLALMTKNLKNWFHKELKKHVIDIIKIFIKSIKNNVMNILSPHRDEMRGIGGIFFDYKKKIGKKDFNFIRDVGLTFKKYLRDIILDKNKKKWTKKQKEIQYIKRGRYIEFNLLYDRGTKFGLQTGGNTNAILMSLPPIAKWK